MTAPALPTRLLHILASHSSLGLFLKPAWQHYSSIADWLGLQVTFFVSGWTSMSFLILFLWLFAIVMSNSIKSGNHWALCTCWYRRCHDSDPWRSLCYFHQHFTVMRWCGSVPLLCPPCLINSYLFKSEYYWQFKKKLSGRQMSAKMYDPDLSTRWQCTSRFENLLKQWDVACVAFRHRDF